MTPPTTPKLLVSVRNVAEARAALEGGCDVLDVKEPARGSMGMAESTAIAEIVAALVSHPSMPVSVALGDVPEWTSGRIFPRLPPGLAYLKLGTAGLGDDTAWQAAFTAAQQRINESIQSDIAATSKSPVVGDNGPSWIAVAYADWQIARGPEPERVIAAASECKCHGVLIDTFSKGRLRLLDWMDGSRLSSLAAQAREAGLTFALAGRLQIGDLPQVLAACPDIVGVRSAACRDGNRSGDIDASAVRAFRDALRVGWALAHANLPRVG